jgi:hypothetical protein
MPITDDVAIMADQQRQILKNLRASAFDREMNARLDAEATQKQVWRVMEALRRFLMVSTDFENENWHPRLISLEKAFVAWDTHNDTGGKPC